MVIFILQNKAPIRGGRFLSRIVLEIMQFAYLSNKFPHKIGKGGHIPHLPSHELKRLNI